MHPRQAGFDAETWLTGAALAGVAIVAWVWLLQTGEQGMGAPAFLGAWLVMMAAMMRNETDAPARFLMLSSVEGYDIVHYPDSDKIGIRAEDLRLTVRPESGVEYLDGEI